MSLLMLWLSVVLLAVVNAAGVVLTMLQLPGVWLMVLATALWTWWSGAMGWGPVVALMVLAALAELWEFVAAAGGSRKAGGSVRGALLALVGAVVGALAGTAVMPVVGTIIGACLGAGVAAYLGDLSAGRTHGQASLTGRGAAVGQFWGTLGKIAIAVVMWIVATAATIWGAAT